ncbi:hypothetical protein H9Y04_45300 [Streptomyces sp. TRM66268-LWL]|uniref:LemA family protein n=1 Tax=Streptomyces polyasparticus TaxID=2767826 RepID=A0ABR7SYH8_9ACTN|nr:hypothetical protein [Streptomyces polyasparticus]MBC9719697.1 hypothetical protein [Streptomyces polyasparticus]
MLPCWAQTSAVVAAASILVCAVTVWTNLHLARQRVRWEARMEHARWESERLRACLTHLIEAAGAANRYIAALQIIDPTDFDQRKTHAMAVIDPVGKAEAELAAAHRRPGTERAFTGVEHALDVLGELVTGPAPHAQPAQEREPGGLEPVLTHILSPFTDADAYRAHAWKIWDDGEPVRQGISAAARLARHPLDALTAPRPTPTTATSPAAEPQ